MVYLIGAGPGDPGLLTRKGLEVLRRAEVVVYDRLVGSEILSLIPEAAEKIDVGKQASYHPVPQEEINRILLEKALEGKKVVRLKGGDPFLFGRGGEELELLKENGISFQEVPGVTSALSVPAYAGIPVTHRDFCSSVHIITGHAKAGAELKIDFDALRRTGGTLVFLMGVTALPMICKGLLAAGMAADMPAAVIERGTLPKQRKVIATVASLPEAAKAGWLFDVFVMPSRYEGYGLALAEAMSTGVPVVVNPVDSLPELCRFYPDSAETDFESSANRGDAASLIVEFARHPRSGGTVICRRSEMAESYLELYENFLK